MRFARLRGKDGSLTYARLEGPVAHLLDQAPWRGGQETGERPWREEELACPVAPSKIVCVGRNYLAHARELGNDVPAEPLLFFKPPSSLVGPGERVVLPPESAKVEHEGELGVVVGKRMRHVSPGDALAHVFGYVCVNDVTARDLQKKDGQWTRAKGFDTFCPAGPWIETELDPRELEVTCRVNASVKQRAPTSQMIFDVPTLLAYVSRVMTLEPGDLLSTGTPEGVSPLSAGDTCEVEVRGTGSPVTLGVLRVAIVAASAG